MDYVYLIAYVTGFAFLLFLTSAIAMAWYDVSKYGLKKGLRRTIWKLLKD